jgi:ABC-type glutathione transport system ATPase component
VLLLEGVAAEADGRRVLDGLDLAVRRGERFGVVGHDDVALRTLVALLAGERTPTAGRVRVDGLDPVRDAELLAERLLVEVDAWPPGSTLALIARFVPRHLDPHRTVLLATSDPGLASAVCDRMTVLTAGRATALVPIPTPTPQADRHLEGGTS